MNSTDTPQNLSTSTGNVLVVGSGELNLQQPYTELWMPDGQVVRIATALLAPSAGTATVSELHLAGNNDAVIPIIEEQLSISKRVVTTGVVRLQKTVQEYQEALNEPLLSTKYEVERVVKNIPVETAPDVRHEGNVTIYPVVEEQLILTKQLILKEEVRVTQREIEHRDTQVVTLRREKIVIEREPGESVGQEGKL